MARVVAALITLGAVSVLTMFAVLLVVGTGHQRGALKKSIRGTGPGHFFTSPLPLWLERRMIEKDIATFVTSDSGVTVRIFGVVTSLLAQGLSREGVGQLEGGKPQYRHADQRLENMLPSEHLDKSIGGGLVDVMWSRRASLWTECFYEL